MKSLWNKIFSRYDTSGPNFDMSCEEYVEGYQGMSDGTTCICCDNCGVIKEYHRKSKSEIRDEKIESIIDSKDSLTITSKRRG